MAHSQQVEELAAAIEERQRRQVASFGYGIAVMAEKQAIASVVCIVQRRQGRRDRNGLGGVARVREERRQPHNGRERGVGNVARVMMLRARERHE